MMSRTLPDPLAFCRCNADLFCPSDGFFTCDWFLFLRLPFSALGDTEVRGRLVVVQAFTLP